MNLPPETQSGSAAAAKPTFPMVFLSVVQQDVWSDCLKFLLPSEMATASTVICTGLLFEQTERASWLALESAIGRADRIAQTMAEGGGQGEAPPGAGTVAPAASPGWKSIRRYPGETWAELYAVFWSLVSSAEAELAAHDNPRCGSGDENPDDDPGEDRNNDQEGDGEEIKWNDEKWAEMMNDRSKIVWITACWLWFGWPERPHISSLSSCESPEHTNYVTLLGSILRQEASQKKRKRGKDSEPKPRKYSARMLRFLGSILRRKASQKERKRGKDPEPELHQHSARMLQCALRLSDAGEWSTASDLLALLLADRPSNGVGRSVGGPSSSSALSCSRQQEEARKLESHKAEMGICICTFLIDRLYSNTYVPRNTKDSNDMSRAVEFGREAIDICLAQSQRAQQEPMDCASTGNNGVGHESDGHGNQEATNPPSKQGQPPAPVSLFPSDSLRLAGACLATGKALAILAQNVGLGATSVKDIDIRPIEREVGNGPARSECELFFREGNDILEMSMRRLEGEIEGMSGSDADSPAKLALFEIQAATCAALGELCYCSASVACYEDYYATKTNIKRSIEYLSRSLLMVQQRLVDMIDAGTPQGRGSLPLRLPTVKSLCSVAPRSLMLLQARTAKDLGKVYKYSKFFTEIPDRYHSNVLGFALAVSSRLHYENHPSIFNIRRLYELGELGSEDDVNQWLSQNPLFEDLASLEY